MATNQSKSTPVSETIEGAVERVAEFNERAVQNGRKAGAAYVTSYEKAVLQFADGYERLAGATNLEWVSTIASAQADLTRELTKAYTSAARELVSA
jgi:hypothetical protein